MSLVQVGVLGPVVASVDGSSVDVGSIKQRAVLALLALRPGRVVSTAALLEGIWGDEPPESALSTLRSLISRIRSALNAVVPGAGTVVRLRRPGYLLDLPAESVDFILCEQIVIQAHAAGRTGDPTTGLERIDRALAMIRDLPLSDVQEAIGANVAAELAHLDRMIAAARRFRIRLLLDLRRPHHALAEAATFVGLHPLDEEVAGYRMQALVQTSRAGEALEVYEQTRARLVSELGVSPQAHLRELYLEILRQADEEAGLADAQPVTTTALTAIPQNVHTPGPPEAVGELLRRAWLRATTGSGSALLLAGEPGCGRSTMLADFARYAIGAGAAVHSYSAEFVGDVALTGEALDAIGAGVAGLVVTIDDLPTDGPLPPALAGLGRKIADRRAVVVLATAESGPAVARVAAAIGATRVSVPRWTVSHIRALRRGRPNSPPADTLDRLSGGNIALVAAALADSDSDDRPAADALPPAVADTIATWLTRLSPDVEPALMTAALMSGSAGAAVAVDLLLQVTGGGAGALDRHLAQATAAGFLQESPHASLNFRHGWVRQYLAGRPSALAAATVHAAVARALVTLGRLDVQRLTEHIAAASAVLTAKDAVDLLLEAVRSARAGGRFASARELAALARGLVGGIPAGAERDARYLSVLTELAAITGQLYGWSSAEFARIVAALRGTLRTGGRGRQAHDAMRRIAEHVLAVGDLRDIESLIEELAAIAESVNTPAWTCLAQFTAGIARFNQGRLIEAVAHAQIAVDFRPGLESRDEPDRAIGPDEEVIVYAGSYLAAALCLLDREPEAIAAWTRIERAAVGMAEPAIEAQVASWTAMLAFLRGDAVAAIRPAERAQLLAAGVNHAWWSMVSAAVGGWARSRVAATTGLIEQARAEAGRLAELVEGYLSDRPTNSQTLFRLLVADAQLAVDPAAALVTIDRALAHARLAGTELLLDRLASTRSAAQASMDDRHRLSSDSSDTDSQAGRGGVFVLATTASGPDAEVGGGESAVLDEWGGS